MITGKLKWNTNFMLWVKRAYSRLELLQQMSNFTSSIKDKIHIYKTYGRSVIEQSCVGWNSSINKMNEIELERVQKVAVSIITKSTESYINKLKELNARFTENFSNNEKSTCSKRT